MRLFLVGTVALLLAPAFAAAGTQEPAEGLAVTVLRVEGKGVYVSWTPARISVMYDVYRGTSLDDLQLIAQTPNIQYTDFAPLDDDAWYVIISQVPTSVPSQLAEPLKGKCLSLRGATGIALTLAHCMPGRLP